MIYVYLKRSIILFKYSSEQNLGLLKVKPMTLPTVSCSSIYLQLNLNDRSGKVLENLCIYSIAKIEPFNQFGKHKVIRIWAHLFFSFSISEGQIAAVRLF